MTKKHFEVIARMIKSNTIKHCCNGNKQVHKRMLVNEMCNVFSAFNPLFDSDRFKDACNK